MPHFGLHQETNPREILLERARLHIRSGYNLIKDGRPSKIAQGIATLYDAVITSLNYFTYPQIVLNKDQGLIIYLEDDPSEESNLYKILIRSNKIDNIFDFNELVILMENALEYNIYNFNFNYWKENLDKLFRQLNITPFYKKMLKPENTMFYD